MEKEKHFSDPLDHLIAETLRSQQLSVPASTQDNWAAIEECIEKSIEGDAQGLWDWLFRLTPVLSYYAFIFFLIGTYAPEPVPSAVQLPVEDQVVEVYLESFESSSVLSFEDDFLFLD